MTDTAHAQHEGDGSTGDINVLRDLARFFNEPNSSGEVSLSYLAEGAANTVFSIHFSPSSNLHEYSNKFVLRLRKDIPSLRATKILKQQFDERIVPLFTVDPSLLVSGPLVKISHDAVLRANDELHALELSGRRKPLRRGVYLPSFDVESDAIFMPNLTYGPGVVVEFKPKWLVQSSTAPARANRCRTCALNTLRRVTVGVSVDATRGLGKGDSGFCPFDLLSHDKDVLHNALSRIWKDKTSLSSFMHAFTRRVQPVLRRLQQLQTEHGEVGLEDFLDSHKDPSVAMALRDCSVLTRIVYEDDQNVDIAVVKLLDLDLKNADGGKREKWAATERQLIEEGWYTDEQQQQKTAIQCAIAAK